jgi:hypothetical protein
MKTCCQMYVSSCVVLVKNSYYFVIFIQSGEVQKSQKVRKKDGREDGALFRLSSSSFVFHSSSFVFVFRLFVPVSQHHLSFFLFDCKALFCRCHWSSCLVFIVSCSCFKKSFRSCLCLLLLGLGCRCPLCRLRFWCRAWSLLSLSLLSSVLLPYMCKSV